VFIRDATPGDVPSVLPMIAALAAKHDAWDHDRYGPLDDLMDRYQAWLPVRAADPRSVFLVAGHDDRRLSGFLVGEAMANIPIYAVREYGFIHDLWVDPKSRGQGIGRSLTRAALDRFRGMGIEQVRLETALANDAARRLFGACGFRIATIDMLVTLGNSGSCTPEGDI